MCLSRPVVSVINTVTVLVVLPVGSGGSSTTYGGGCHGNCRGAGDHTNRGTGGGADGGSGGGAGHQHDYQPW